MSSTPTRTITPKRAHSPSTPERAHSPVMPGSPKKRHSSERIDETVDAMIAFGTGMFSTNGVYNPAYDAIMSQWLINVVRELHKFASDEETGAAIQEYLTQKNQ